MLAQLTRCATLSSYASLATAQTWALPRQSRTTSCHAAARILRRVHGTFRIVLHSLRASLRQHAVAARTWHHWWCTAHASAVLSVVPARIGLILRRDAARARRVPGAALLSHRSWPISPSDARPHTRKRCACASARAAESRPRSSRIHASRCDLKGTWATATSAYQARVTSTRTCPSSLKDPRGRVGCTTPAPRGYDDLENCAPIVFVQAETD